jgi:hypothetical protein
VAGTRHFSFQTHHTGCGAYVALQSVGTEGALCQWVEWFGCEADSSSPSGAKVKNE